MKKYLLGLLAVPVMSPLLSIASADSVGDFTSDTSISVLEFDNTYTNSLDFGDNFDWDNYNPDNDLYYCASSDVVPVVFYIDAHSWFTLSSNNYCSSVRGGELTSADALYVYQYPDEQNSVNINGAIYISQSPITYGSSAGDSDSVFPEITVPSSFTSGLTQLVENFGGTIANWIPAVLLIALGITAIFALFRVVRGYAKSAFKG